MRDTTFFQDNTKLWLQLCWRHQCSGVLGLDGQGAIPRDRRKRLEWLSRIKERYPGEIRLRKSERESRNRNSRGKIYHSVLRYIGDRVFIVFYVCRRDDVMPRSLGRINPSNNKRKKVVILCYHG